MKKIIKSIIAYLCPMQELNIVGFVDVVSGEQVNYYMDANGLAWMSTSRMRWRDTCVRVPHYDRTTHHER